MRIFEIASAEEQIELWKLVSNSVWQSLEVLQRSEQQRKAAEAAKAKPKAPAKGKRLRSAPLRPQQVAPPSPARKPPASGAAITTPIPIGMPKDAKQAAASAQLNAQQPQAGPLSYPLKRVANAVNRPNQAMEKTGERMDDWHSANGSSPLRR